MTKYDLWIADYVSKNNVTNKCGTATKEMVKAFPELKRIHGFVVYDGMPVFMMNGLEDFGVAGAQHIWCIDLDGNIVDPTVSQFVVGDSLHDLRYTVFEEAKHGTLPTGKCPNCGEYIYDGKEICSKRCERLFLQSLDE